MPADLEGELEIRLTAEERKALAAAAPVLGRILEQAKAASPDVLRATSSWLRALTFVAAGIIGSTTVIAGAIIAGLSSVLPAGGTAGAYETLYLRSFGDLLAALAMLLFVTTLAALLLQLLRWLIKTKRVSQAVGGAAGGGLMLLVLLWPGYLATEAAACTAVALSLELPNTTPLDEIEDGWVFGCEGELAGWGLTPGPTDAEAATGTPPSGASGSGTSGPGTSGSAD